MYCPLLERNTKLKIKETRLLARHALCIMTLQLIAHGHNTSNLGMNMGLQMS